MGRRKVPSAKELMEQKKQPAKKDPLANAKHYDSNFFSQQIPKVNIKTGESTFREPFPKIDLKELFKNDSKKKR